MTASSIQPLPGAAPGVTLQGLARQRARGRALRLALWVCCAAIVLWLLPLGAWAATSLPATVDVFVACGLAGLTLTVAALYARTSRTQRTLAALDFSRSLAAPRTEASPGADALPSSTTLLAAVSVLLFAAPVLAHLLGPGATTAALWLVHSPAILLLSWRWGWRGLLAGTLVSGVAVASTTLWADGRQSMADHQAQGVLAIGAAITLLNVLVLRRAIRSTVDTGQEEESERQQTTARAHRLLRARDSQMRALLESASDVVMVLDADGARRGVSPTAKLALGYDPAALVATELWSLIHPEDVDRVMAFYVTCLERPGVSPPIEFRHRHRNGSWRYLDAIFNNLLADPSVEGIVISARDVTERKQWEEQLTRQAFYDTLTGLPNRKLFMDRLTHAVAAQSRNPQPIAVMFLDLDRFKNINDSLGHGAGDALLTAVAERLTMCVRAGDTVARFGGDEFVILLEHDAAAPNAMRVAERIVETMAEPFQIEDAQTIFTGVSVGIVVSTPPHDGPEHLLRHADTALYQAKASGRGQAVLFEPSMNARAAEQLSLEADLRRALERGELEVYYQPEVDLTTMAITGFEALVRWQHPHLGMLLPERFIPLAEETDLIVALDRWVLQEACRQTRAWQGQNPGSPPLTINVNVSARRFQQPDLVEQVAEVLRETGLPPACLRLEITENIAVLRVDTTITTLAELKRLGVRVAIDDFGMGYSSLSYLQQFAVDTLKIDRFFVGGITAEPESKVIVQAITAMAHALGITVTAEGIETGEHLARVRALACERGQGHYFSEPLAASEAAALLNRGESLLAG